MKWKKISATRAHLVTKDNLRIAAISVSSKRPGQWVGTVYTTYETSVSLLHYKDTEEEMRRHIEAIVNLEGLV